MDVLNQISNRIEQLHSGEKWTLSVQDLLVSRADFQSIFVFLSRESEKGVFSLSDSQPPLIRFEQTSLTITKN